MTREFGGETPHTHDTSEPMTVTPSSTSSSYSSGGSESSYGATGQSGSVTSTVAEKGQQAVSNVTQQAKSRAEDQKTRAAEGINSMAQALRQASQQLRDQDKSTVAQYGDRAADQAERFAGYLRQRDVNQMVSDLENMARRRPAAFLAGAFGLGMLGARFLKSSMSTGSSSSGGASSSVHKSIEVNVPVRTAYNQWTQFQDFPQFMGGVQEVRQLDDKRLFWKAEIAGKTQEWYAVITDQVPDRVIAWRSITGAPNSGRVTFESLGMDQTRVTLQLDYQPQGVVEKAGDMLGVVSRRIDSDLSRYKEYIESRGVETGAWRGEIRGESVERS